MGVGWIPSFVDMCGRQSKSSPMMGDWPFELSGDELLRRNVRFTPLPGFDEGEALDVVAALPEMALFSSDYPHQEGNADPINLYGDALPRSTRSRWSASWAATPPTPTPAWATRSDRLHVLRPGWQPSACEPQLCTDDDIPF